MYSRRFKEKHNPPPPSPPPPHHNHHHHHIILLFLLIIIFPLSGSLHAAGYKSDLSRLHTPVWKLSQENFSIINFNFGGENFSNQYFISSFHFHLTWSYEKCQFHFWFHEKSWWRRNFFYSQFNFWFHEKFLDGGETFSILNLIFDIMRSFSMWEKLFPFPFSILFLITWEVSMAEHLFPFSISIYSFFSSKKDKLFPFSISFPAFISSDLIPCELTLFSLVQNPDQNCEK